MSNNISIAIFTLSYDFLGSQIRKRVLIGDVVEVGKLGAGAGQRHHSRLAEDALWKALPCPNVIICKAEKVVPILSIFVQLWAKGFRNDG